MTFPSLSILLLLLDAFDTPLLISKLQAIKRGEKVVIPKSSAAPATPEYVMGVECRFPLSGDAVPGCEAMQF